MTKRQVRIIHGMLARLCRGFSLFCVGGSLFHTIDMPSLTYLFIMGAVLSSVGYAYICFTKLGEAV